MSAIKVGATAPTFTLPNQAGQKIALKDYRDSKNVVLYFYPKAMTPGCTDQACGLRDTKTAIGRFDAVVLGVSTDSPERLAKFAAKYDLNFDLLADADHRIADKYGVWGLKKFMGREFMGLIRTTFVIGKDGKIKAIMDKVKTKSHHNDLIDVLKDLDLPRKKG